MKAYFAVMLCVVCATLLVSCGKTPEQQPAPQPETTAPPEKEQTAVVDQEQVAPPPTPAGEQPAPPAGDQLVPIPLELPKPMFVGTPTNLAVPNLEKPLGRPRPAFLAPQGTKNLASRKPVSGSDEQPIIGELAMVTDGDKDAGEGSYVELGPKLQYVTIDLKAPATLFAVVLWHFHKQPVVYHDVIVQVADDPDFVTNVHTLFNNDIDNTAGQGVGKDMSYVETAEGKLVDAKGVRGRYVRCYSRGNTANELNHYIEVEVYGKPLL